MASAVVQVRLDSELKRKATHVYESLGLDLSSAVRMFFTRSVQVGGIPFPTSSPKNVSYDYEAAMENIMESSQQTPISRINVVDSLETDQSGYPNT